MTASHYTPMLPGMGRTSEERRKIRYACARCAEATDALTDTERAKSSLCRKCFGKATDRRPRELNDLTGAEWAASSRSVEAYPDVRTAKQRLHGACFPQSLAEEQIKIFTKARETVLDPFAGIGTTLDAAFALNRQAIGIELNPTFAEIARNDLTLNGAMAASCQVHVRDAQELDQIVAPESVDFLLTSPPYSSLLRNVRGAFAHKWAEHSAIIPRPNPEPYSSHPDDLGNMPYPVFLERLTTVMSKSLMALRSRCYSVWVVKDFRNLRAGVPYVNLHGDVIACAEEAGFRLWDIRIFDQTRYRPLVCLGFPSRNFYLNIGHSYILTFRKD